MTGYSEMVNWKSWRLGLAWPASHKFVRKALLLGLSQIPQDEDVIGGADGGNAAELSAGTAAIRPLADQVPNTPAWCAKRSSGNQSPAGWETVAPVAVTLPDATVSPVDQQFRTLMARDFSRDPDRFALGLGACRHARTTLGADGPLAIVWNDMLVWHMIFSHN